MTYVIELTKDDLNELTNIVAKEQASLDEKSGKMSKTFYKVRSERMDSLQAALEKADEKGAIKPKDDKEVTLDFDKLYLAKGKKVIKTIALERASDPLVDLGDL